MAAGAISGLALVLTNLNRQQTLIQRKVRVHFDVENVSNTILRLLFDSRACTHTLGGKGSIINDGRPVPSIKNSNGGAMFDTAKKYGSNSLRIEAITLEQANLTNQSGSSVNLQVVFKKVGKAVKGYDKIIKKYPLSLDLDSSLKLISCYSNHQFIMSTVSNSSCNQVGGTIDPQTGKCIPAALNMASRKFCEGINGIHTNPECDLTNIKKKALDSSCNSLTGNYQQDSQECTLPTDL